MQKTISVPWQFEFDTCIGYGDYEGVRLWCDCCVDVYLSTGSNTGCVNPESVDVYELKDLDTGKDMTYLQASKTVKRDIIKMINKNEDYLLNKAGTML